VTEKANQPLVITTTFEERKQAENMAAYLLNERLVACAQITGPISSTYWWQDKIVSSDEFSLSMKTLSDNYKRVEQVIISRHSYDVPEIVAIPVVAISDDYLQWLIQELDNSWKK
jgi:periplasmic divalent cation tolerance protein